MENQRGVLLKEVNIRVNENTTYIVVTITDGKKIHTRYSDISKSGYFNEFWGKGELGNLVNSLLIEVETEAFKENISNLEESSIEACC